VSGAALAEAAQGLVGTRFRLHGRDPATGLDCIGVFSAAMAQIGCPVAVPNGYALRTRDPASLLPAPEGMGFAVASEPIERGDVLLFRVGPAQFHLGIAISTKSLVHAHAGLRRVVAGPFGEAWRIAAHWRAAPPPKD
jgi:cell wall-associated NlpC family hydrolase